MRIIFLSALALLSAACSGPKEAAAPDPAAESSRLTAWLDVQFEEELQRSPEYLTSLGRKELYDQLDDRSEAQIEANLQWRRDSVAEMKGDFAYDQLDDAGKDSWDIWTAALDEAELRNKYRRHNYLFARSGDHTSLPNFIINFHRVDEPGDMDAWISRVSKIDEALDQLVVRATAAADSGIRQPGFAYDQAIEESRKIISGAPFGPGADSPLYADAKSKIDGLLKAGKIDQAKADELLTRARTAMIDQMKPGYERLLAWLESDRGKASPQPLGASQLPDGAGYYSAALQWQTTTDMTADQIHDLGLSEVARIREEMEAIRQQVGFKGDLKAFFADLRDNPKFLLPNTDAGREDYLSLARGYITAMEANLPEYFGILPKGKVEVRRVEAFREEDGGAAHYFQGTPDGSRPGVFYAHLSDMAANPPYQLETLAYHEALPGHHMQIAIAQELTGVPKFRTQYGHTAYIEGWGLYAEALGKEMGFFTDPYNDMGRLSGEMWRAIRLVVDTGLHAKGWTQEQAVQYALENSPEPESSVRSEVRRYIVWPGQATAYKIGMIRIQQLREKAKTELGTKFDIRAFHDVVLDGGSVPLGVLEKKVDRWIAKTKAG
jgi:uncharacterized protein (DUF885 family)